MDKLIITPKTKIYDLLEAYPQLEDILIGADIGARPVQNIIEHIREAWKSKTITETAQIYDFIKNMLKEYLERLMN